MNIYKDNLHPAIAWGVIALGVILIGLLVFLSYQSTSDELSAAQQAEQTAPSTAPFLPRSYSVNGDKWFVIKSDEYTLSEWGISMRIPFQYPKTIAATYVKDENAYYFADIKTFEKELHSEIEKIIITDGLPKKWTYPSIQPKLFAQARKLGYL